jgi:hypothetical protein
LTRIQTLGDTLQRPAPPAARLSEFTGLIAALIAFVLWIFAVHDAHFLQMGSLGLISVLGWPYFLGLAIVTVGLAVELMRTPLRTSHAIFLIVVLIVFLFGTAPAVEPVASLTDSWIHAGFIQYFIQHGRPLDNYDARFSWPGSFSLGAVIASFTGRSNVYGFLRWFPLVSELSYLAPMLVIAKFGGVDRRTGLLGVALAYSTNWIYQDYFSPQGLNYFFFLVIIAAVLACWRPRYTERLRSVRGTWRERIVQSRAIFSISRLRGNDATTNWSPGVTLAVLLLLSIVSFGSAISHQLTPYAIILALLACFVARRLGRPEFVVVAAILALGWLSLGASNYWVGHLSNIFGSAGKLSSTIGSNVVSRVTGSSAHLFVVKVRILITLSIYLLAAVGVLRRFTDSRVLETLAAAPFFLVLAQNYGGEGLLRVVLFGLPFTALLAASAILPTSVGTIRSILPSKQFGTATLRWAIAIVLFAFALATTLVRGGNDSYESYSNGELAAVNYAYAHAHTGQTIGTIAPYLPIGQEKIDSVFQDDVAGGGTPSLAAVKTGLLQSRPRWIILSQSQEAWGELVAGYPKGWEDSVEVVLVQHGYSVAAAWPTATVLRLGRS